MKRQFEFIQGERNSSIVKCVARTALLTVVCASFCSKGFAWPTTEQTQDQTQRHNSFSVAPQKIVQATQDNDRNIASKIKASTNSQCKNVVDLKSTLSNWTVGTKNGCKIINNEYQGLLANAVRAKAQNTQSVHIQDSHATSCYAMLSEAFKVVGAVDLLKIMRSDSTAAMQEIYRFLKKNESLGKSVNTGISAFSMLVNNLSNAMISLNNKLTVIGSKRVNIDNGHPILIEYNLAEILNFTINYMVYGVGLDSFYFDIFLYYLKENLTENGGCLNGFIDRFFMLIASDAAEKCQNNDALIIDYTTWTIVNCLGNASTIKLGKPKRYEDCKNHIFQIEEGGKADNENHAKTTNFLHDLTYNSGAHSNQSMIHDLSNSEVLENFMNSAVDGEDNSCGDSSPLNYNLEDAAKIQSNVDDTISTDETLSCGEGAQTSLFDNEEDDGDWVYYNPLVAKAKSMLWHASSAIVKTLMPWRSNSEEGSAEVVADNKNNYQILYNEDSETIETPLYEESTASQSDTAQCAVDSGEYEWVYYWPLVANAKQMFAHTISTIVNALPF